jgi:hypothetical protein
MTKLVVRKQWIKDTQEMSFQMFRFDNDDCVELNLDATHSQVVDAAIAIGEAEFDYTHNELPSGFISVLTWTKS